MAFTSKSPYSDEVFQVTPFISNSDLDKLLDKAAIAQKPHSQTSIEARAVMLNRLSELLDDDKEGLSQIISKEMGKPIRQSVAEIEKCSWLCKYYAQEGPSMLEDEALLKDKNMTAFTRRDPLGLMLAIMPWNFPFWQLFRCAVPAILAGNGVLLKHAPNVPQCAVAMESLFEAAGFEPQLLTNLFIDIPQIDRVLACNDVRGMSLTGSTGAGKKAASAAGGEVAKIVLELGGSDPFIVFNDADLERAIEMLIQSRFLNNGQSCIAAKRLLIDKRIESDFMPALMAALDEMVWGDPLEEETFLSCLARQDLKDHLGIQVRQLLNSDYGGKIAYQKPLPDKSPSTAHPVMVIDNLNTPKGLWKEEFFGPVLSVWTFDNEQQAIEMANHTIFGLGASIWTNDFERGLHVASGIESGNVFINDMVKSDPRLPFGGIKQSGIGRELAREGLLEFTNSKTICIHS